MVKYTEEFKSKVRKVYGNQFDTILSTGNAILDKHLDDFYRKDISIETILSANSLEELKEEAQLMKDKIELYNLYWNQLGAHN